jgi:hypothetical protein
MPCAVRSVTQSDTISVAKKAADVQNADYEREPN